jgi:trk system potassium uptake protein TrkH
MSTVATFGIYLPGEAARGYADEFVLLVVMMFALSRATFSGKIFIKNYFTLSFDREFRLGLAIIFCSTIIIFCLTLKTEFEFWRSLRVAWGACFTSISFLTTTGLVSEFLPSDFITFIKANLILSALAMFGGGVATTAGGIKLLRIYILSIHCQSEVHHLLSPRQVITGQSVLKSKNYNNAMLACVFFMVFILSFALITLGLSLTGISINEAATFTLGTITNTGPIIDQLEAGSVPIIEFEFLAKIILMVSMVLGRIEVLALLALLNPDIYS